ncbi:hypothetical protein E2C01_081356 [Portunus trituberculatus]|uniref:Uncharacterized protein n=1 Tax=Portunus trituberculatus TaxID=210409 RepID=A0A5B7IXS4_PORTR|nr:hypothetical protein [Portunus trituberculatus]
MYSLSLSLFHTHTHQKKKRLENKNGGRSGILFLSLSLLHTHAHTSAKGTTRSQVEVSGSKRAFLYTVPSGPIRAGADVICGLVRLGDELET